MTTNEKDERDEETGVKAGGDVETKGPSRAPDADDEETDVRAGGDVETKGASKADEGEPASGAGGTGNR